MNLHITVDDSALKAKLSPEKLQAAVARGMTEAKGQAELGVKRRLTDHTVTGFLRSQILSRDLSYKKASITVIGSSLKYAGFVEEGTGIYGPHATPIIPLHAKVMRWHPKTVTGAKVAGASEIYRAKVAGQEGVHMFRETFENDQEKIAEAFRRGLKNGLLEG